MGQSVGMQVANAASRWRTLALYCRVGKPWWWWGGQLEGRDGGSSTATSNPNGGSVTSRLTCGNQEKENIIPDLEWTAGSLLRVLQLKVGNSSITITRELVRNAESQSLHPRLYWIRIWILTRSPSDMYAHYKFEKLPIPILSCLPWQVTGLIILQSSLPFQFLFYFSTATNMLRSLLKTC